MPQNRYTSLLYAVERVSLLACWSGSRLRSGVLVEFGNLVETLVVLLLGNDVAGTVVDDSDLDAQLGSLERAGEIGVGLEIDDILNEDISFHMAPYIAALSENPAFYVGRLTDDQLALGIHGTVERPVDTYVRRRSHDAGNSGALGYPAQLIGLGDYFCFCHDIDC